MTEGLCSATEGHLFDQPHMPHVLILGGGFAGLAAGKALKGRDVRVTLIDRENHHLFQPLLYQVATAGLSAPDIAQPLRHIFASQSNVTTLMDEVLEVDLVAKEVELSSSKISYDYLIFALGVTTGYFGNDLWARHAPGLKTLDEAMELRRRVLTAFERAECAEIEEEVDFWLTFVVVGGGPTGVELAGAIAELAQFVMASEFRRIDTTKATVHLIEAAPRLLATFAEPLSEYSRQRLERMSVTVHLNAAVSDVSSESVTAAGVKIPAGTVLWAAGVEGNPVARKLGNAPLDRAGRVLVDADLTMPGYENVFVVGDLARLEDFKGKLVPGVAPAASQMGRHAARQIMNDLDDTQREPFVYLDKGNMATIGRSSAVAQFGKFAIKGYPAWAAWLGVHLVFLMGMRNRITVFLHWAWSYIAWHRGARIITKKLPGRRES